MRVRRQPLIIGTVIALIGTPVLTGYLARAQDGTAATIVEPPTDIQEQEFLENQPVGQVTASDIAALRYYLTTNQMEKYEAEVRRLQERVPGWRPPDNLLTQASGPDVQPLWDLFAEGRYADVRAMIAQIQSDTPNWTQPADLVLQLNLAQERDRLINASNGRQWRTVVQIAEETPELLSCETVDMVWRTAEAFENLGQAPDSQELYRRIVETCDDPDVRLATVQKAQAQIGVEAAESLLEVERTRPTPSEARQDLDAVATDLQRARLAEATEGEVDLDEAELARVIAEAERTEDSELADTIGWYYLNRRSYANAETWFTRSLNWGGDSNSALGLVVARQSRGNLSGAEQVAVRYAGESAEIRQALTGIYVDRLSREETVPPDRLAQYEQYASRSGSATMTDAIGWEHYSNGRYAEAAEWFERSLSRARSKSAAEGLTLSYVQLGRTADAEAVVARYQSSYPDLGEVLTAGGSGGPVFDAATVGDNAGCVREARALMGTTQYTSGIALQHGWCLMALQRPVEAQHVFDMAATMAADSPGAANSEVMTNAAEGQAVALLSQGRQDRAMAVAQRSNLSPQQMRALELSALQNYVFDAMEQERYREALRLIETYRRMEPPSRGMRLVEGWAHFNIGNRSRADAIFSSLDREFSTEDTRDALRLTRQAGVR